MADVNQANDLWELAKTAGPFGTCFALAGCWWINRFWRAHFLACDSERKVLINERNALLERTLVVNAGMAEGLKDIKEILVSSESKRR